jgi:[NiFe] hydrogenase assembly HybE family chaperone
LPTAGRVAGLVRAFERVERTRMAGVPIMNLKLRVEAVGFEHDADKDAPGLAGVLITPWFMNVVWLPDDETVPTLPVGATRARRIGCEGLDFIGAEVEDVGRYEACSIWSPMFEFEDQAAARATAQALLELLRKPVPQSVAPAQPARRALLFGRSAVAGGPR